MLGVASGFVGLSAFESDAVAESDSSFHLIVHPENKGSGVTRQFVADAFLKNITEWSDGTTIKPIDQRADSTVRRDFSQNVLHRSVAAVRSYWQQRIFSGRGVPPPELDSDQAVVNYVRANRNAVGYVRSGVDLSKVRVLDVR